MTKETKAIRQAELTAYRVGKKITLAKRLIDLVLASKAASDWQILIAYMEAQS
jgi:hypothetical protein